MVAGLRAAVITRLTDVSFDNTTSFQCLHRPCTEVHTTAGLLLPTAVLGDVKQVFLAEADDCRDVHLGIKSTCSLHAMRS